VAGYSCSCWYKIYMLYITGYNAARWLAALALGPSSSTWSHTPPLPLSACCCRCLCLSHLAIIAAHSNIPFCHSTRTYSHTVIQSYTREQL
jgi:hypothetical protein